jgi:hypothetical protein
MVFPFGQGPGLTCRRPRFTSASNGAALNRHGPQIFFLTSFAED